MTSKLQSCTDEGCRPTREELRDELLLERSFIFGSE
jgi:hypothetical protein